MEDIDCAGIINRAEPAEGQDEQLRVVVHAEVKIPIDTVMDTGHDNQIKKEITDTSKPERPTQVTLSGLLNAIDGTSSPEGHVLIMTTNFPEALDEVLTRPGRVDVKVEFGLADAQQL